MHQAVKPADGLDAILVVVGLIAMDAVDVVSAV